MSTLALLFAIGASVVGAAAAVLQSRGAKAAGDAPSNALVLLTVLIREPIWLAGAALAGVSGALHAVALRHGSLIEVESIMVTGLLAALALGIVIGNSPVTRRDWAGAMAVIVGLVAFLLIADPQDGDYDVAGAVWAITAAAILLTVGVLVVLGRRTSRPNVRAALFGTAAAVCLGSAAVVLKQITVLLADHGPLSAIAAFLVTLGMVELGALILQQIAFRAGDLGAALAPFVGGNPLVAGGLGIVIYSERFHHSLDDLLGAAVGIAVVVVGIIVLASSPTVAAGTGEGRPPSGVGNRSRSN
jgi:hypothetical protein